jgi:hypothetical protein
MGENLCYLYIRKGINNRNLQGAQKTKLLNNQWLNEEMVQMNWTEFFLRKRYKWPRKNMKKCSTSLAIKEKQIKINYNSTSLLLEWLSQRTQTTNTGKDVCVGGRVSISVTTMENSMEAPQKPKNKTDIWSSNITPRHTSEAV